MLVTIYLDDETRAITKEWLNVSGQIRQLIKEQAKGMKPICLKCGATVNAIIGTPNVICQKCKAKFRLMEVNIDEHGKLFKTGALPVGARPFSHQSRMVEVKK